MPVAKEDIVAEVGMPVAEEAPPSPPARAGMPPNAPLRPAAIQGRVPKRRLTPESSWAEPTQLWLPAPEAPASPAQQIAFNRPIPHMFMKLLAPHDDYESA